MRFQHHPNRRLTAAIAWADIQQINADSDKPGLYVWAVPTSEGAVNIQKLMARFPDKKACYDATEYHCTVLYGKEIPDGPLAFPADKQGPIRAWVTHFETWQDHKDRTIVVARIASNTLTAYNAYFLRMGFKNSYPEFNAHVTVAKDVSNDAALRTWLNDINHQLSIEPMPVPFYGSMHGSALS